MTTRKNEEAAKSTADGAEEAEKPKAIQNNYHGPLQISDGMIIPASGSITIDDMEALAKNKTVAAWLKAGVLEVI